MSRRRTEDSAAGGSSSREPTRWRSTSSISALRERSRQRAEQQRMDVHRRQWVQMAMAAHGMEVPENPLALTVSEFEQLWRRAQNTNPPRDESTSSRISQTVAGTRGRHGMERFFSESAGAMRMETDAIQNGWEFVSAGPIDSGPDRPRARRRLSTSGRAGVSPSAGTTTSGGARSGSPRRPQLLRPWTPPLPPTSYRAAPRAGNATSGGQVAAELSGSSSMRTRGANADTQIVAEDEFDEDNALELQMPLITGDDRVIMFDSDDDDDVDDDDDDGDGDDGVADFVDASGSLIPGFGGPGYPSWEDYTSSFNVFGEPQDDFDDWFMSSMRGSLGELPSQRLQQLQSLRVPTSPPPDQITEASRRVRLIGTSPSSSQALAGLDPKSCLPRASVNVRQEWNQRRAWKPYIYREPAPNQNNPHAAEPLPRLKPIEILAQVSESSRIFSIARDARVLSFDCTNADDMGRGSVDNILSDDRSIFVTSRAKNVNLEFSFLTDNGVPHRSHCTIERIRICAPKNRFACTELLVLASSRRCDLKELAQYDSYTFARYEKMAKRIERRGAKAVDPNGPVPIAYFWLPYEDGFKQMQILPHGKTCKYVYVKMIRGHMPNQESMAIRLIEFHGWAGARAFSEVAMC